MIHHLGNLIRINTRNPPGNELEAVKYITKVFDKEKVDTIVLESAPGRGNLIARIKGDGSKKPLLLMSHLDVVGVEPEKWDHDPFSGEIIDGSLWGRGALDCKNSVVLWMMILLILKREKITPKRDVIFLATADEETGGRYGARWLLDNHFELIEAEAALNEGGGFGREFLGHTFYTYQTAEKGNIWLRLTVRGKAGHASMPGKSNPTLKVIHLVNRLIKRKGRFAVTDTVRKMVEVMSEAQRFPVNILMKQILNPILSETIISAAIKDEATADGFRAMLKNTVCPTVLRAGQKVNVIPSEASAEVDIRILPGEDSEKTLEDLIRIIGDDVDVEVLDRVPPTESPLDHLLADSIRKTMARHKPDSFLIPLMLPGSSDGAFFRTKGTVVYGFTPVLPMDDMGLAHAHNERISLQSLEFSLNVGLETVLDFVL